MRCGFDLHVLLTPAQDGRAVCTHARRGVTPPTPWQDGRSPWVDSPSPSRDWRNPMATYMSFVKWTDQGIKNAKDAPKRLDAFEAAVKAADGK